ncbi:MAG: porphobilinogen synthase [Deltaproteobacteria bacterium]|nr:porphobilinogen synthase [Deltaproteobacteria bacterium]
MIDFRFRRLRLNENLRRMTRRTQLSVDHFIYPLFVVPGEKVRTPIVSMPGVFQVSIDQVVREVQEVCELKIPAVLLFGQPTQKDVFGSQAYDDHGIVQRAIREIKSHLLPVVVISDVCLCAYTTHGHCGLVDKNQILNDETCEVLAKVALSHAKGGVDMVAPSDMMDGRVGFIRHVLDQQGFSNLPILSYAAKFASSFYGPFREAQHSTPQFGDRKSYQLDPANASEALREIEADIQEGADMVMVKPALPYLDILSRVRDITDIPLVAYQVSGEYVMIEAAAAKGYLDRERAILESLYAIRRAGADMIITYFAKEVAKILPRRG